MTRFMQHRAPHVSMEAMQSTSWPAADEAFPDTHLTACDLNCSGVTASWHAITWSDRRPGYVAHSCGWFRSLLPSLRAHRAAGMGYTLQYWVRTAGRPLTMGH